jgi:hypothetical protein
MTPSPSPRQIPEDADDDVVCIVSENANTLKFDHASFEDE